MWTKQILDRFAARLKEASASTTGIRLPAIPLSAEAFLVLALREMLDRPVVWITDGQQTLESAHRDLLAIAPESAARFLYYPAWENFPVRENAANRSDPQITGGRYSTLLRLPHDKAPVITTCIQALMQKTVSPAALKSLTHTVKVGDELDLEAVSKTLSDTGYDFATEVQDKGQAARRGGLLDVWPPTEPAPLRIEFFGSTIESIRLFSPVQQTSLEQIESVAIPPNDEWRYAAAPEAATLLGHLSAGTVFVWSNEDQIIERAGVYQVTINEVNASDITVEPGVMRNNAACFPGSTQIFTGTVFNITDDSGCSGDNDRPLPAQSGVELDIRPIESIFSIPHGVLEPDILADTRRNFLRSLGKRVRDGDTVAIFFDTQGSADHFRADIPRGVKIETGTLSGGFTSPSLKTVVVAESDLYGHKKVHNRRYSPPSSRRTEEVTGERISDAADIEPGDLVVHVEHGIGRYLGLFDITFNGQNQEALTIEYADGAKLHVPVSQAHLLSRYVGVGGHKVELHRLGGRRWTKEKIAAQAAIQDLAASLLETQAHRNMLDGHAFPHDNPWQKEMEAAFPFRETIDQQRAIDATKKDMESRRPMDRLICGDAGYGKTEVAVRAAFKAVMGGKQVAVLVPTTILAQQHYETFSTRMSAYPVRVEVLSRFCSDSTHARIIKGLADGSVDIVIGTHSIIQPSVQFKDLGLVVIDEEQKFGVAHKERLKQLRKLVDVLTMTATPIPRTLYMSMTGARDMSIIQTPPRERMAVETIVAPNTDKIVREAILRELNREGQVFYLYNRVMTIELVETRIRQLVPEARIAVAHGQMAAGELAEIMQLFIDGEYDVLLCTTIIESGVDIPGANTILIDRADRFGLAELYQLRGRVGRSNCKAYAYFLLPPGERLDADARARMETLKRYSHLGAGFNLALRDLEIRGSGNLLGTAQSGHITAIGFDLYCQLLRRTIALMKGEPVPPVIEVEVKLDFVNLFTASESADAAAVIPYDYIEDERLRINAYRKMSETATEDGAAALRKELKDRYGSIPAQVERLLKIVEIRVAASAKSITEIEVRDNRLMLKRHNDYIMKGSLLPRLSRTRLEDKLDEIITLIKTCDRWGRSK